MTSMQDEVLREYLPEDPPVATFWRQATEGTFYWRLLVPARHLPARVNSLKHSDVQEDDPLLRQDGVAVWQFLGDLERTRFAARVQSAGVRTLMEVDDNYLIPPPQAPNTDPPQTLHLKRRKRPKQKRPWQTTIRKSFGKGETGYSHQAHRMILPSIDGLIVSTDELANRYDGLVPAGIHVCPNSVDPDDWETVFPRETNVVGFAGSDSHFYDLDLVDRALSWAAWHRVTLVKLGAGSRRWRWPHVQVDWTDNLSHYRRNLQLVDIGLCPLKRSDWHDCKSDIKAMEYLMAGAVPIVQADSPCYRDWLELVPSATTEKEWEREVKNLVRMPVEERHALWRNAHEWLLEHKTIHQHIHKWFEAIGGKCIRL